MKIGLREFSFAAAFVFLTAHSVFAQAFGEYGRTVGGMPQGGITAPRPQGSGNQGGIGGGGVGDVGGRGLPTRLVVVVDTTGLYPRQDEETERLAQLMRGDLLVPMIMASGVDEWYMVKTQKGVVGWVKSGTVKEELTKK